MGISNSPQIMPIIRSLAGNASIAMPESDVHAYEKGDGPLFPWLIATVAWWLTYRVVEQDETQT